MFIRVTTFSYDLANEAALLPLLREVERDARAQPGNRSYALGLHRASGRGTAVTTWDTAAQAAGARTALGDLIDRVVATGVRFDGPGEVFEVVE
jgi:hypothetical protein